MIIAVILQGSLSDTPPVSAISTAADWVSNLLFGPLATAIAVIAIASIGIALMSGRVDVRRGLSVVLGCFLLFGAKGIADGLKSAAISDTLPTIASVPSAPVYAAVPSTGNNTNAFDPYAGAAVIGQGQ